ncbi:MAG: RDD family protein [Campylobacteraceae bacterium]|nr:RDD family protein [Campylobacteraceae bacterium]
MNNDNLELASMPSRIIAFIIDDLLISLVFVLLFWDQITSSDNQMRNMLIIISEHVIQVLLLKFIYQGFFVWYYGATIGKIVTKIRVIDYNNLGKVTLTSSLIRSGTRIFSEYILYIGFIIGFFNDGKQTLHDKIGRTLVVNA